jgi:DNA-directed RNA polymerase subunit RPC12/RpoP
MKFLCIDCDTQMAFEERQQPGDGTFTASFACPRCGRRVAMLANPMETQLVSTLGVEIGGRTLDEQPLEFTRNALAGRDDAFTEDAPVATRHSPRPVWSADAETRLSKVPGFVRGMVKKIYTDYARERSIAEVTPEVMDRARTELGLEGM